MTNFKIFIYWYGDKNIYKKIKEKFLNLVDKKIISKSSIYFGPKVDDINALNRFSFYRKNLKIKRYSFMSDLYRVFKLSNNSGIYIDSLTKINHIKFLNLLKKIEQDNYTMVVVRENGHLLWNGFFYSKNNKLFKNILNFYKNFPYLSSKLTGPIIFSMFYYKEYGINFNNNDVLVLDSRDINPFDKKALFNYDGLCSWKHKNIDFNDHTKTGGHDYFYKNALNFERKKYDKFIYKIIRWFIKHELIFLFPYVKVKLLCIKFKNRITKNE